MIDKVEARDLVNDLFEEEALLIGGLVLVYGMDDDLVWHLVRSLDFVRRKFLRRVEDGSPADGVEPAPNGSSLRPHPAIADFLRSLREA